MVNRQQEAKDGLVWLEKYIEQLESERDHLDAKCAELEEKDAEIKRLREALKFICEPLKMQDRDFIYTKTTQLKQTGLLFGWTCGEIIKRVMEEYIRGDYD